jgi:hypothetical protein
MTLPFYGALFPTRLSQKQATAEFETTDGGCLDVSRRCADWPRCGHHHYRRSVEARRSRARYGRLRYSRKIGEALHPEREPLEALNRTRQTIGSCNFAGQYQQTPAPDGGGMIKQERSRRYDRLPQNSTG